MSTSKARAKLRDYARETVKIGINEDGLDDARRYASIDAGMRGELAGLAFEALQKVLSVCKELEQESRQQPIVWGQDQAERTKAEVAERIQAALLKGLGG